MRRIRCGQWQLGRRLYPPRGMLARARVWIALSLGFAAGLLAGCLGGSSKSDSDDSCHYDCFGAIECRDGTVIAKSHTVLSCSKSDGTCPQSIAGTCQKGCAVEHIEEIPNCPMRICRENYPKQPGDACMTEADCHPTVAVRADGGVWQAYLRCDITRGICVETAGPELGDWLGPCDPGLMAQLQTGAYGAVEDATCSGGLCVYYVSRDKGCVYQGCTRPCATDEECPQGAVCQDMAECPTPGSSAHGYCKPGPRNEVDTGLSCR
jgi:hypothetical protein